MPRRAEPLTAKRVESLTTDRIQQDFADGLVPGLALRVARSGSKTWTLMYKGHGSQTRRLKIGSYPVCSLADARKRARAELRKVEQGMDPAADRKDQRTGQNSFRTMAEEILEKELRVRRESGSLRESTFKEWDRILSAELLPAWGDRPVAEISRRDVRALAEKIAGRGSPAMAGATVGFANYLFGRALDREFPTLVGNPAYRMKLPWKKGRRDRYLTRKEIKSVWNATVPDVPGVGLAIRLAILTAQRMGSIAALRWDGIEDSGAGAIWRVPEEHNKGRRVHLVPLSTETIAVIEEAKEAAASGPWAFPSRKGTERPYLQAWNQALHRIRKRADLSDNWTIHDTRRTFRTHAARACEDGGLGVAPNVADAVLGHSENSLGWSRYTGDKEHYLLSEKKDALTKWGGFVAAAIEAEYDDE